jgi:hypothetical protein
LHGLSVLVFKSSHTIGPNGLWNGSPDVGFPTMARSALFAIYQWRLGPGRGRHGMRSCSHGGAANDPVDGAGSESIG